MCSCGGVPNSGLLEDTIFGGRRFPAKKDPSQNEMGVGGLLNGLIIILLLASFAFVWCIKKINNRSKDYCICCFNSLIKGIRAVKCLPNTFRILIPI